MYACPKVGCPKKTRISCIYFRCFIADGASQGHCRCDSVMCGAYKRSYVQKRIYNKNGTFFLSLPPTVVKKIVGLEITVFNTFVLLYRKTVLFFPILLYQI